MRPSQQRVVLLSHTHTTLINLDTTQREPARILRRGIRHAMAQNFPITAKIATASCATFAFILVACLASASPVSSTRNGRAHINGAAIADKTNTSGWLTYGRTYDQERFSPLNEINDTNASELKVDWFLDLPSNIGLRATPLVVNGVMYFPDNRNVLRAVDARTGSPIWEYDPDVAGMAGERMQVSFLWGSRGVAFWDDKLFLPTRDGHLIAIDAHTGKKVWSVLTVDTDKPNYITGAPLAFKGKVVIGNGGTEEGASRGYVTAYDAETGKQLWRFYVVPGNPAKGFENDAMRMAAKTWTGEWWKVGGGGNPFHGLTYDPEFDALYIGTGNGSPWNQKIRSPGGGDNLFLSSIVALDPDTGAYRWHYQTTPGETWDYHSCQDIVLADLKIHGRVVKAILHAPKNGFFYVIDRATGKLISAEPIDNVTWASRIDLVTGRPVENPGVRRESGSSEVNPGPDGVHNTPAMSYNPITGLVYIPTIHSTMRYTDRDVDLQNWTSPDWRKPYSTVASRIGVNIEPVISGNPSEPQGSLQAWDPVAQKRIWEVPMSSRWNDGTLTTAGNLVLQGQSNGLLVAYNAKTGKEVWRYNLGLGISAPPITYSIEGRQYISILVGFNSPYAVGGTETARLGWAYGAQTRRVVTFSLKGAAKMPSLQPPLKPVPLKDASFQVDPALAARGANMFMHCGACHGGGAVAGGLAPDLRASAVPLSRETFAEVVRGGALRPNGMPSFKWLSDVDLDALRHYIRYRASRPDEYVGSTPGN
jgi:quinohemoprotein ethanol dehydrogenase